MLKNDAVHVTSVFPNNHRARAGRGISYDGEGKDENGMTIPIHYIENSPLMQAAGIDVAAWDSMKDDTNTTAVNFFAITELKDTTERGKRVKRRKIVEVYGCGAWWSYTPATNIRKGDALFLPEHEGARVTVERIDTRRDGPGQIVRVNDTYDLRASLGVLVGRV